MTRQVIADVLLAAAVLVVAASALGVLLIPGAAGKLHYLTPAAVVAPVFVAVAVFVREGLDENTGETFVALFFLIAASPFLAHATIRAIGVRRNGDWRQRPRRQAEPARQAEPDRAKERTS